MVNVAFYARFSHICIQNQTEKLTATTASMMTLLLCQASCSLWDYILIMAMARRLDLRTANVTPNSTLKFCQPSATTQRIVTTSFLFSKACAAGGRYRKLTPAE